jgi:two-component system chemotaxis response regulator CheB
MSATDTPRKIRVLIVEDSPVMLELLAHVLGADPGIRVIGAARNGEEAIEAAARMRPDVIAMDFHMPTMNGLDATRKIMETYPTPIVIVSGSSARNEVAAAFRVMEAGALAIVEKPAGPGHPEYEAAARELVQTVKLMSEVKVVRRWPRRETGAPSPPPRPATDLALVRAEVKLVAIGASTGGPIALKTILSGLPKDFPVPILMVQHIASGFTQGFVEWLAQSCGIPVHVATHGEYLLPGHVYVAPDGFHMKLESSGRIALSGDRPENGHRPSVSYLFRSVAAVLGRNAVGVLLTGMGKDGAEELKLMREKGAVTIAQDQESSIVHGMPGEAIGLDAATHVLSPGGIAEALGSLVRSPTGET